MSNLPNDLIQKIDADFADADVRASVKASLDSLWDRSLNVGPEELSRAIVFLVEGNYDEFQEVRKTFYGDPRDVLLAASKKARRSD